MTRVLGVLGWFVPVFFSTDILEARSRVQARCTGGGASVNKGRSQRLEVPPKMDVSIILPLCGSSDDGYLANIMTGLFY